MHRSSLIRASFSLLPLMMCLGATACRQQSDGEEDSPVANVVANLPSVPRPSPSLDRAGILAAVAQAASAVSAGADIPTDIRALNGRQFEVRIRFGCRGPSSASNDNWLRWALDSDSRSIRLYARPTISRSEPLVAKLASKDEFEAVEGFWIPRPWLLDPVCPATAAIMPASEQPQAELAETTEPRLGKAEPASDDAGADQPSDPLPTSPRVGIAQFFTSTEPRTGRRDNRAYEAVYSLQEGQAIDSQGFNLVLSGRLRAFPGRGVVACAAASADSPPECIVSAEFHRTWIERPDTREVIAEWGGG